MPYTAYTVPASASPAAGLVTAIETALAAHASWSFVEEVTQTDVHRIWKCSGATNVAGIDFHVAFVKPATATSLGVKVFEGWNSGTDRMHRPVPYNSTALPVAGDLTTGATDLLLTDTSTAGRAHAPTRTSLSTSIDIVAHVFVTKSRLVVVTAGTNAQLVLVAGAFPVQAAITDARFKNIMLSLQQTQMGSSSPGGTGNDTAGFTRSMPVGGGSCWGALVAPASMLREGTVTSATSTAADPATGRFLASEVALLGPISGSAPAPGFRSIWPDAVLIAGNAATGGDTVLGPAGVEYVILGQPYLLAGLGNVALPKTLADV